MSNLLDFSIMERFILKAGTKVVLMFPEMDELALADTRVETLTELPCIISGMGKAAGWDHGLSAGYDLWIDIEKLDPSSKELYGFFINSKDLVLV